MGGPGLELCVARDPGRLDIHAVRIGQGLWFRPYARLVMADRVPGCKRLGTLFTTTHTLLGQTGIPGRFGVPGPSLCQAYNSGQGPEPRTCPRVIYMMLGRAVASGPSLQPEYNAGQGPESLAAQDPALRYIHDVRKGWGLRSRPYARLVMADRVPGRKWLGILSTTTWPCSYRPHVMQAGSKVATDSGPYHALCTKLLGWA
ncbi:hypothetical protein NDU88_006770 [Pleurodeles waltl]|uniref:Uncharacterized protein n=1 Tax=Pleurodeles waltl TaxID=8319 RepID=A0AAV7MNA2_PLEWA|nr:hypothetical protein NDU88_006770 [Pleurodeles waltl]